MIRIIRLAKWLVLYFFYQIAKLKEEGQLDKPTPLFGTGGKSAPISNLQGSGINKNTLEPPHPANGS